MVQIGVIGKGDCSAEEAEAAETAGYLIASNREVLVCGGLGGVMEAACRGAKEAGGTTVGILPGKAGGNAFLDIVIRTNLGHARNALVVQSSDAIVAVGGGYGTLSEIGIALKEEIPVFGWHTWDIGGVFRCASPEEAVLMAVRAARL